MGKLAVTVVAGFLAGAAVLGAVAVTRTVSLGSGRARTADTAIRARTRQLNRFEASLRRELARKPPALPPLPKAAPAPAAASAPPPVVYRRPAPIVVVRHLHRGDDGGGEAADSEGGGGGD
jgi:hypothetical protein